MNSVPSEFWSFTTTDIFTRLQLTPQGLSAEEARQCLIRYGLNLLQPNKRTDTMAILLSQFRSPIIVILLLAVIASFFLHDSDDAVIIFVIVLTSGLLGFLQERGAANAVQELVAMVRINVAALREASPASFS